MRFQQRQSCRLTPDSVTHKGFFSPFAGTTVNLPMVNLARSAHSVSGSLKLKRSGTLPFIDIILVYGNRVFNLNQYHPNNHSHYFLVRQIEVSTF